jgi:hypothetical protein
MTLYGQKDYWGHGKKFDDGYKEGYADGHNAAARSLHTMISTCRRLHKKITPAVAYKFVKRLDDLLEEHIASMEVKPVKTTCKQCGETKTAYESPGRKKP